MHAIYTIVNSSDEMGIQTRVLVSQDQSARPLPELRATLSVDKSMRPCFKEYRKAELLIHTARMRNAYGALLVAFV